MVAQGRALVREWGASVQCRGMGEEEWGGLRLVVVRGGNGGQGLRTVLGEATGSAEREGSGRAGPVRVESEGGGTDLM